MQRKPIDMFRNKLGEWFFPQEKTDTFLLLLPRFQDEKRPEKFDNFAFRKTSASNGVFG